MELQASHTNQFHKAFSQCHPPAVRLASNEIWELHTQALVMQKLADVGIPRVQTRFDASESYLWTITNKCGNRESNMNLSVQLQSSDWTKRPPPPVRIHFWSTQPKILSLDAVVPGHFWGTTALSGDLIHQNASRDFAPHRLSSYGTWPRVRVSVNLH